MLLIVSLYLLLFDLLDKSVVESKHTLIQIQIKYRQFDNSNLHFKL